MEVLSRCRRQVASRKSLAKTCFCILSALPDLERLGFT